MGVYEKGIAILILLCSLASFSPSGPKAQPLGVMTQRPAQQSQKAVLSSAHGRFVFGQIPDSSKDQFMLDTATGRLWRLTKRTDIGVCLSTVPYRSAEGECSALPQNAPGSQGKQAERQRRLLVI
jgi:hypothetical protein